MTNQVQPEVKPDTNLAQVKVDANMAQEPYKEPVKAAESAETDKDINWKKFRENREAERKKAEETAKRAAEKEREVEALKAALEAVVNKPAPQQQQYTYEQQEETEDQKIDRKVQAALAIAEQRRQEQIRQEEAQNFPQRLTSNFSDFNQVCTSANIDYLEYHYPEVAEAFKHAPDSYEKWAAVYKAVKRFVPNTDSRKDQQKADKNLLKPQSISSPGMTQGGETAIATRLTDAKKAENWRRMQKAMNKI